MGPRQLPVLSGCQVLAALRKAGFEVDRIKGSHHLMLRPNKRSRPVSVPVHGNKQVPRGTLAAIIEEAGMTLEEFIGLL